MGASVVSGSLVLCQLPECERASSGCAKATVSGGYTNSATGIRSRSIRHSPWVRLALEHSEGGKDARFGMQLPAID